MAHKTDRRTFLGASAALATAATLLPHATFAKEALTADLGKITDLDSGEPVLVTEQFRDGSGKKVKEEKVYVLAVKSGGGIEWVVLSAICTHLKCKIKFNGEKDRFVCPCHGSEFTLDGTVLNKPAKKPLPDFSNCISEEDGRLIMTK